MQGELTFPRASSSIDVVSKLLTLEIGHLMASISKQALIEIRWAGLTRAEFVRYSSSDGVWYGDRCGCFDDRCAGYHHEEGERCHCLQPCIDQVLEAIDRARRIAASPALSALESTITGMPDAHRRWGSADYCSACLALELALGNIVPAYSWMRSPDRVTFVSLSDGAL